MTLSQGGLTWNGVEHYEIQSAANFFTTEYFARLTSNIFTHFTSIHGKVQKQKVLVNSAFHFSVSATGSTCLCLVYNLQMRGTGDSTNGFRIIHLTCVSQGLLVLCQNDPLLWRVSVISSLPGHRPIQKTHGSVKTALSKCSFSRMKASYEAEPVEVFWWGIWAGPMQLCFKEAVNELMRLVNNWLAFLANIHTSVSYWYILYL